MNRESVLWFKILTLIVITLTTRTNGQVDPRVSAAQSEWVAFEPVRGVALTVKPETTTKSALSSIYQPRNVEERNSTRLQPVEGNGTSGRLEEEEEIRQFITRGARKMWTYIEPEVQSIAQDFAVSRGRGGKKKGGILLRALVAIKVALLGFVLPLGVAAAKVLSWKAVTLSLLAFMLAKIVFVKNLFMSKPTTPAPSAAAPPSPPIVINTPPHHEHVWKRQSGDPMIHVKPEVHVHQSDDGMEWESDSYSPQWNWSERRSGRQQMAYRGWLKGGKRSSTKS